MSLHVRLHGLASWSLLVIISGPCVGPICIPSRVYPTLLHPQSSVTSISCRLVHDLQPCRATLQTAAHHLVFFFVTMSVIQLDQ